MSVQLVPAAKVLVVGGIANFILSFVLGFVLSGKRGKDPIEKHHWLLVAHEVSLQEGFLLIACAFALGFADMGGGLAMTAAALLVAASFFQDLSGILNWLKGTGDQFREKSPGYFSAVINAVLNTVGLGLVAYGVIVGVLA